MTLRSLAELVSGSEPPPDAQPSPWATAASTSRRSVLKAMGGIGLSLGFSSLLVFRAAREAAADGYDILNSCPSYASGHACNPGCGPSVVCSSANSAFVGDWYGDCCDNTGAFPGPPYGYHENRSPYYLRPNECLGGYDGWIWGQPCGTCGLTPTDTQKIKVKWRCHDGYTVTATNSPYLPAYWPFKSICKGHTEQC